MPKVTARPGVSLDQKQNGSPYKLMFLHPLEGRQIGRSTGERDYQIAVGYAKAFSRLLASPDEWRSRPDYIPDHLWRSVWLGNAKERALVEAVGTVGDSAITEALKARERVLDAWIASINDDSRDSRGETEALVRSDAHLKSIGDAVRETREMARGVADENKRLRDELAVMEAKLLRLETRHQQNGEALATAYAPKTVEQAVCDYFRGSDRGSNATDRSIANMEPCLRRFQRWLGDGRKVGDVRPEEAKQHLIDLKDGQMVTKGRKAPKAESVRMIGQLINTLMAHANPRWDKTVVQRWAKANLEGNGDDEAVNQLWLDQPQVDRLLEKLPAFWRDVAEVQWAGGFRPEELCNLLTANVTLGDVPRIRVARYKSADGSTVWRPKTSNSTGDVPVLASVRPTLERLTATGTFLLFPYDAKAHGGRRPRDAWKAANHVWRDTRFTATYLKELRKAAAAAGITFPESGDDRGDGRTLRRSAGKRFLLASGGNLSRTAAFLRNTTKVCERHYARIVAGDVSEPI